MAIIRPSALPLADSVSSDALLVVDTGASVEKATPLQVVDAAIPLASKSEAEAGSDNGKRVTPLRVKQAIVAQTAGGYLPVANRTAMAALDVTKFLLVWLRESGREGPFMLKTGSAPTDTQQGIYVASGTSGYYWERIWDKVHGKPEWFGAVTNSSVNNNVTALHACHALCPVMVLQNADYWVQGTITFATSYRKIVGVFGDWAAQGSGTRIILTGTAAKTAKGIVIGTWPVPATQASGSWFIEAENFAHVRDVGTYPVTPPSTYDNYAGVAGIVVAGVTHTTVRSLRAFESQNGFFITGVVQGHIEKCIADRETVGDGTHSSNDFYNGFLIGGAAVNYGFAGANASVYFDCCLAVGNAALVNPTGYRLREYMADTFLNDCESANLPIGMMVDGNSLTGETVAQDIYIRHPVLDQCSVAALWIDGLNAYGLVDISYPYIAPSSTGVALYINNSNAQVTVTGGTSLGLSTTTGFSAVGSSMFNVTGLKLRDHGNPVKMQNVGLFVMAPSIFQSDNSATNAVDLTGTNYRGTVAPVINGTSAKVTAGINCHSTTTTFCKFDLTGLNPGAFVSADAAEKLYYNGATWGGGASFGTGNVVAGVLG